MWYLFIIDEYLRVIYTIIVGEILWRALCVIHEYTAFWKQYEETGRIQQILKRSYSINNATLYCLWSIFCITCIKFGVTGSFPIPPISYMTFLPLYLVYRYLDVGFSYLQYANFIRQNHGLDYASGMASNYFHGYLKLILPSYENYKNRTGIRERMALYEAQEGVQFAIKRLIILIPKDMYVEGKIESHILSRDGVKPLETVVKNRAGVERPYKNDVYRFNKPINGKIYYVALEGATPLLSFYESMKHKQSATWLMCEMKREILLKFYRHLKNLLNEWPETQNEVELVMYNSIKADRRRQDIGDVLLAHLKNIWNERDN